MRKQKGKKNVKKELSAFKNHESKQWQYYAEKFIPSNSLKLILGKFSFYDLSLISEMQYLFPWLDLYHKDFQSLIFIIRILIVIIRITIYRILCHP